MVILKVILGFVAFAIAVKLLAFLLMLVGIAFALLKLAVIVGIFALIGWVIYKVIIAPGSAQRV